MLDAKSPSDSIRACAINTVVIFVISLFCIYLLSYPILWSTPYYTWYEHHANRRVQEIVFYENSCKNHAVKGQYTPEKVKLCNDAEVYINTTTELHALNSTLSELSLCSGGSCSQFISVVRDLSWNILLAILCLIAIVSMFYGTLSKKRDIERTMHNNDPILPYGLPYHVPDYYGRQWNNPNMTSESEKPFWEIHSKNKKND